eukprot:6212244-Pleurochrysis_carterae.AAC.11
MDGIGPGTQNQESHAWQMFRRTSRARARLLGEAVAIVATSGNEQCSKRSTRLYMIEVVGEGDLCASLSRPQLDRTFRIDRSITLVRDKVECCVRLSYLPSKVGWRLHTAERQEEFQFSGSIMQSQRTRWQPFARKIGG